MSDPVAFCLECSCGIWEAGGDGYCDRGLCRLAAVTRERDEATASALYARGLVDATQARISRLRAVAVAASRLCTFREGYELDHGDVDAYVTGLMALEHERNVALLALQSGDLEETP